MSGGLTMGSAVQLKRNFYDMPNFCSVPWTEGYTTTVGTYGVCCLENSDFNQHKVTIAEPMQQHWNGQYIKQMRQAFVDGQRPPQCQVCWKDDDSNKQSMRQRRNQRYLGQFDPDVNDPAVQELLEKTRDNGHTDLLPRGFNFSTGNTCQLRCIECSPTYSRSIIKDYQKLQWSDSFKTRRDPKTFDMILDQALIDKNLWPMLKNICANLEWLQITGGEPTISKPLFEFLKWCVDQGYSQNLSLMINTNAVNIKPDFIAVLQKFRTVIFGLSVDGYGPLDEYIRYPTNWAKKESLIHQLMLLFPYSSINMAVSSLNINKIDDMLDWVLDQGYLFNPMIVSRPDNLSCHHLPLDLKDHAREILQHYQEKLHETIKPGGLEKFRQEDFMYNALGGLTNYLDLPRDESAWQQSLDIMRSYDTIRSRSIGDLNPQLSKYL